MPSASPWWKDRRRFPDGNLVSVGLIHFDLGGHSAWATGLEQAGSRYEAYRSRKVLQQSLMRAVDGYGFDMHHWAGDGGLFAAVVQNQADADRTYEAMRQMLSAFEAWRKEHTLRENLMCRICGTCIPDLCLDNDPGNWYSSELNTFVKYERQLSYAGTIRITLPLRNMLDRYAANFPKGDSVQLPNGTSLPIFQDSAHKVDFKESRLSFRHWLNSKRGQLIASPPEVTLAALPENAHQYGDSVILNAALDEAGYREIYLNAQVTSQVRGDVFATSEDRDEWQRLSKNLAGQQVRGTKCRVHSFMPEFSDDPVVRVKWSQGEYVDAKAFAELLSKDHKTIARYANQALRVLQGGTELPNTLSNHSIVVLGKGSDRHLLMAHRRSSERPGSYSLNCWSVSFEEQFNPIEDRIFDRVVRQDRTIDDSIRRGLEEEILGKNYAGPILIATHAFQLESSCLNYGFLAIVELPELSFAEVLRLWPTAIDANEHDALVAMPLKSELIHECLRERRLPKQVTSTLEKSAGFARLREEDHRWHPTSAARLALAMWHSGLPESA